MAAVALAASRWVFPSLLKTLQDMPQNMKCSLGKLELPGNVLRAMVPWSYIHFLCLAALGPSYGNQSTFLEKRDWLREWASILYHFVFIKCKYGAWKIHVTGTDIAPLQITVGGDSSEMSSGSGSGLFPSFLPITSKKMCRLQVVDFQTGKKAGGNGGRFWCPAWAGQH